jgi:citrate lyase synthetase
MEVLLVHPKNQEEMQVVKQFLKERQIKADVMLDETPKQRKKREILEGIEQSGELIKLHQEGKIRLQSADELLAEL